MISWGLNAAGDPQAQQLFARPVIYLDHWAVRQFADKPELGSRLIQALKARRGTWAVSLLNIMEFINVADQRHAVDFEALIDRMLPNVFFIEFQAFDVMDRERAMLEVGSRNAPYGDVELLRVFAHNMPISPIPFTADGLVKRVVTDGARLKDGFERFKATVAERIIAMRAQMDEDATLAALVKGSQKAAEQQRALLFFRELLGSVLRDRNKKVTDHDAMDLLHAVVPVAYCDYRLLDGEWKHRVQVVAQRLVEHNIGMKPSQVFSKRKGGIEQFLVALESAT